MFLLDQKLKQAEKNFDKDYQSSDLNCMIDVFNENYIKQTYYIGS